MFGNLSQIGKKFTDAVSERLAEEQRRAATQNQQMDPATAARVLHTQTPDPESITKPEEIDKQDPTDDDKDEKPVTETNENTTNGEIPVPSPIKRSAAASPTLVPTPVQQQQPNAQSDPRLFVPGTSIKFADLPPEIRQKLRKFQKYEDKYPALFEAYKVEKKKTAIISSFEKALQESTPISNIAEIDSFKEYLGSLSSKNDMLAKELRNSNAYERSVNKDNKELTEKVKSLEKQISEVKSELDVKIQELETKESEPVVDTKQIDELKDEIQKLNTTITDLEKKNGDLKSEVESTKKSKSVELETEQNSLKAELESLKKENSELSGKLEAFESESKKSSEELKELSKSHEKLLSDSKKLNITIEELQEKLMVSKRDNEFFKSALEREAKELNKKIETLESSLASSKKLNQAFKDKLNEQSKSTDSTTNSMPATNNGSKSKKKKNNKKKQQNQSTVTTAPTHTKDVTEGPIADNTKETETVDDLVDGDTIELKHNYGILKEKLKKLESAEVELEELKVKHSELLTELDSQKSTSQTELESSQTECNVLKSQIKTKNEEIEDLKDMMRDLGDSLVTSKDELKTLKEASVSNKQLTEELESKTIELEGLKGELEVFRVQNSAAVKDYEVSKASLIKKFEASKIDNSELEKKLKNLESELEKLNQSISSHEEKLKSKDDEILKLNKRSRDYESQLKTLKASKDKLAGEVDVLTKEKAVFEKKAKELSEFKSNDTQLKLDLASLKTSLNRKEKIINENENRIKFLQEEKSSMNDQLIELKVKSSELASQNKAFQDMKNSLISKNESQRQEYNELMLRLNKVTGENNKLMKEIEEIKDKYSDIKDLRNSSNSQIDLIKRRCEELNMLNKEYENRVDSLEVELSEARSMLQERTRESGTIRKLMIENEESQTNKSREIKARLSAVLEEKEKLENEYTLTFKKKQKEVEEYKSLYEEMKSELEHLSLMNQDLESQVNKFTSETYKKNNDNESNNDANGKSNHPSGRTIDTTGRSVIHEDSEYNNGLTESLRESLSSCESRIRELEGLNSILKSSNEENSQKLIRMNKKNKLLSQQLRRRYSTDSTSNPGSPRSSRKGSILNMPILSQESQQSPIKPLVNENGDSKEVQEKAEYIKNVLLGYLEHKDQRMILMPVMKALLYLSDDDEKRFLNSLTKQQK